MSTKTNTILPSRAEVRSRYMNYKNQLVKQAKAAVGVEISRQIMALEESIEIPYNHEGVNYAADYLVDSFPEDVLRHAIDHNIEGLRRRGFTLSNPISEDGATYFQIDYDKL